MTLSVLVFQEADWWVAQCIEYDIASQQKSRERLAQEIVREIAGYMIIARELGNTVVQLASLPSAPEAYRDAFVQAADISLPFFHRATRPRLPSVNLPR
jgi:hypothetical protein